MFLNKITKLFKPIVFQNCLSKEQFHRSVTKFTWKQPFINYPIKKELLSDKKYQYGNNSDTTLLYNCSLNINCKSHPLRRSGIIRTIGPASADVMFSYVTKNMSLTKTITRTFRTTATKRRIIKIQDREDFNKHVLNSKEPVVIVFFATWCGRCKILLPRVEKIIEEYKGTIHHAKVDIDIDDNSEIALEYGVPRLPGLVLMKDGKVQGKMDGDKLKDEDKLKHFISKLTEPIEKDK